MHLSVSSIDNQLFSQSLKTKVQNNRKSKTASSFSRKSALNSLRHLRPKWERLENDLHFKNEAWMNKINILCHSLNVSVWSSDHQSHQKTSCVYDVFTKSWLMSSSGATSLEELISYLGLGNVCVHWVFGFEDFLDLLLRTEKESPKKILINGRGAGDRTGRCVSRT